MQALLLATGVTQKLPPLTERVVSPLITVMNRPVMLYNLELLGRVGFKRILVSVAPAAGAVERYFGDGRKWGVSLEYILQRDGLGSAGVLRWARRLLHEPFIILPADEIVDFEIAQAIREHLDQYVEATVVVQPGARFEHRTLLTDANRCMLSLDGKNPDSRPVWTDTGVYLFDPRIIDIIPPHQPFDIHADLLPLLTGEGIPVWTYPLPGYWNPLDTLQHYAEAQNYLLSKALKAETQPQGKITYRYQCLNTRQVSPGIWAGRNIKLHPRVKLTPPVCIGQNTWVGPDVELGPRAVIGSDVVIDQGATIQHSIVYDNTFIGKLVNVENRLVNQDQLIDLRTNEYIRVKSLTFLGKANAQFLARGVKNSLDFCLALLLFLICLPLVVTLAALLLASTGRVIQKIPCRSQRSFRWFGHPEPSARYNLWRFNTRRKDGRLTRLGRWVEAWEGERLPELLNVMKGDLAMVGLMPDTLEGERHRQAGAAFDHDDTPGGFTGMWYLQSDAASSPEDFRIADAYYLATRSWSGDWKILLNTPVTWYRKVSGRSMPEASLLEGVDHGS